MDHDRFVYKPHSCSSPLRNLCIAAVHYIAASSQRLAPNDAPASTLVGASLNEPHIDVKAAIFSICMYCWGEPERASHRRESCDFLYIMVRRTALFKRMRRCALPE